MAKKESKATKTSDFKEFEFEGQNGNVFEGRIYYPCKDAKNGCIFNLSLKINGLVIVGSRLYKGKDGSHGLLLPSYKSGDEYKSQVYFVEKEDIQDMKDFAEEIGKKFT